MAQEPKMFRFETLGEGWMLVLMVVEDDDDDDDDADG